MSLMKLLSILSEILLKPCFEKCWHLWNNKKQSLSLLKFHDVSFRYDDDKVELYRLPKMQTELRCHLDLALMGSSTYFIFWNGAGIRLIWRDTHHPCLTEPSCSSSEGGFKFAFSVCICIHVCICILFVFCICICGSQQELVGDM